MFTEELADKICLGIAQGQSLREVCAAPEMPAPSTIILWVQQDKLAPGFAERYARARETQAELQVDQLLEIADNIEEDANSRRLRVDARKWIMSKLLPKKYGDATLLKHADPDGNALKIEVTRVKRST